MMSAGWTWARFWIRRRKRSEMDEELRFHVEQLAAQKQAEGLSKAEARRLALIEFGGVERTRAECERQRPGWWIETVAQDVRYALRGFRRSKAFAASAVLTLALGIGANAIVFSVLNALILKPLNVPNGQSLYMLENGTKHWPSQSYPDYRDLRERNRSFEDLIAYHIIGPAGLNMGKSPSVVWPYLVSGNYFDALGIQPYLGRFLHDSDEKGMNSVPYVVLSYDCWRTRFGGDRGAIGRVVEINKHPMAIIGVAPPDFRGTELFFAPDMWASLVDEPELTGWSGLNERMTRMVWVVGHVKPGVTPAQATADLNTIAASLAKTYPQTDDRLSFRLARPGLVGDLLGRPARAFMAGMMLLAGLILLAACVNLGSLVAARAADRAREIAVRMALGSRRSRILRQLLTEALMVSLGGGVLGVAGGLAALRWLSAWRPIPNIPINVPVNPDARTYAIALLLALASGVLFGLAPARMVLRTDPYRIIRSGTMGAAGLRRFTVRDLLLAAQIAICAVLVTASLVAVRGMVSSLRSNFGFRPNGAMIVNLDLKMAGYNASQAEEMEQRMEDAVAKIPGVSVTGYANNLPLQLGGGDDSIVFRDNAPDFRASNAAADAYEYVVSPEYFRAASTTLLMGRSFTRDDNAKAPRVAVVNEEFARKVFGSAEKAIGSHFKLVGGSRIEVVGIAENGKYQTLTENLQAAMFFPILQVKNSAVNFVVRSEGDPREIAGVLERKLHGLDPALPLDIETWNQELDSALFASRVATVALGVLGLLGAMLAMTGIFGMASYVVSKRMRELGIRIALGAQRKQVLRPALGRVLVLLATGSMAGLLLGVAATKLLSFIVYQATPRDPTILGGVVLSMMLIGLVAAWIPAQRALGADPLLLLREE